MLAKSARELPHCLLSDKHTVPWRMEVAARGQTCTAVACSLAKARSGREHLRKARFSPVLFPHTDIVVRAVMT